MISRIFPKLQSQQGHWAAGWLLGLYILLKLVMSTNTLFNTRSVAVGGDGFPLQSYPPEAQGAILMLFSMVALGQLALALAALAALVRFRALLPFIFLLLMSESIARRLIVSAFDVTRTESTPVGTYVNYALLTLLVFGFLLSLLPLRHRKSGAR